MDGKSPQDGSEKLRQKIARLQNKLRKKEAAQRRVKRKLEDHKKFSVGGHFVTHMEMYPDDDLTKAMQAHMVKHLRNEYHRKLLGLPPLPTEQNTETESLKKNFQQT